MNTQVPHAGIVDRLSQPAKPLRPYDQDDSRNKLKLPDSHGQVVRAGWQPDAGQAGRLPEENGVMR